MKRPAISGTALVTGASGFIGGHLRDALLAGGTDVVSLRREGSPPSKKGRSVVADYADLDGLTKVVAELRPDYVFHVAGVVKGVTYADFARGNVMPTRNLLTALRAAHPSVKRFVHVSSLTSYGPSTLARPHQESDTPKPIEFYGQSKLEAERAVQDGAGPVPWTILRPSGVYGPADAEFLELFKLAARGLNVFYGNRAKKISLVYVDDVVDATIASAVSEQARGRGYFLCDGTPRTWGDFQATILRAGGKRAFTLSLPEALVHVAAAGGELASRIDGKPKLFNKQKAAMGVQEAWTCTHAAAASDFGYAPEVQLEDGVKRAWAWYRAEKWV